MYKLNDDSIDISYFAQRLDERKKEGYQTTLLLGSRVSALFRSEAFYRKMREYGGSPSFEKKTVVEQFKECYALLTGKGRLKIREVDDILNSALRGMTYYPADLYLAALVMQRLFDVIISTSLDDFLVQALRLLGCQTESTVRDGYQDLDEERGKEKGPFLLVNVFGQLKTRRYQVKREKYFEERSKLRELISESTQNAVLCLGYDPVWDAELGKLIHTRGSTFWYINEEELSANHPLHKVKEERGDVVTRTGVACSYDCFVENLYAKCGGTTSAHYITQQYIFNEILRIGSRLP
jgi:hypothetical protein